MVEQAGSAGRASRTLIAAGPGDLLGGGPVLILGPIIFLVVLGVSLKHDLEGVAIAMAIGLLLTISRVLWWRHLYGGRRVVATDESLIYLVGSHQVRTAPWADIGYIRFSRGVRDWYPTRGGPSPATLRVRATSDVDGPAATGDFAEMLLRGRSYELAAAQLEAECRRHNVDYFDDLGNQLTC